MKRLYHITVLICTFVFMGILQLSAQEQTQNTNQDYSDYGIYTYAEQLYNNGYFDHALELAGNLKSSPNATMRSSAYRLMALCHIEQGNLNEAKQDVQNLLTNDPYFSPSASDNPILKDLIGNSKHHGGATITTASQQAESIDEAPVPVTLITEDMLHAIGARTLKDALLAYVPGMTDVSNNEEMTIAMRGVYSGHQDKILILLDGHRLNSYTTNRATPDYSISLEKIKQIEVLRGPASSIYGGVALTAVINLITKDASDINGLKIKGAVGNHGQLQGDMLFGKRLYNIDFKIWGNIYQNNGETVFLDGGIENQPNSYIAMAGINQSGNIYIDRYRGQPTYDLGFTLQYSGLRLLYNTTYSNRAPTYTMSSMFAPYCYDKYGRINGSMPGISNTTNRINIQYTKSWKNWDFLFNGSYDHIKSQNYMVVGDTIPDLGDYNTIIPNGTNEMVKMYTGGFQSIVFSEIAISGKVQVGHNYSIGKKHKGSILFGLETIHFNMNNSTYQEGDMYNRILRVYDKDKQLYTGHENMFDAFLQLKHTISKQFIINAGLRYDHKRNMNQTGLTGDITNNNLDELSPRIALIWNKNKWDIKASYARSFVDAPYFYRNNFLDTEWGPNLEPEYLKAFQLSVASNEHIKGLSAELSLVYNNLNNYIYTYNTGELLCNGGEFNNFVSELTVSYRRNRLNITGNITYQKMLNSENYASRNDSIFNIPTLQGNIVAQYNIKPNIEVHANVRAMTEQYISNTMGDAISEILPSRAILGCGASYTYRKLVFAFDVHNLLNTQYSLGGITPGPIRQQSRWLLGSISYTF